MNNNKITVLDMVRYLFFHIIFLTVTIVLALVHFFQTNIDKGDILSPISRSFLTFLEKIYLNSKIILKFNKDLRCTEFMVLINNLPLHA